ncbi:MAG: Mur ligase family protein, partial [Acidimicrobiales bacterium]
MVAVDLSRFHHGVAWATVACCVAACVPAGLRWLRVAQREHYLAGSVLRFAGRWWRSTPVNVALAAVGVVAAIVSIRYPLAGAVVAGAVAAGPLGLSLRGRTSPLAWTSRLRRLAAAWALFEAALVVVGVVSGLAAPLAVVAALAVPLGVDLACRATSPLELRLSAHFVDEAAARLQLVDPVIVAITGSYGKTSTKGHIACLVGTARTVVATPASFNNRAGLARAVNEHLAEGTEVFVAEMGTYGRGEIADLCRWCPPDIAVITAIGPVHLERFGSEDRVLEAKSEIIESADDVVLQVDDPRL